MQEIKSNIPFKERLNKKIEKIKENVNNYKLAKSLSKEKKYEEIFTLYGRKIYSYYASNKYIKQDIKKLLELGNFEDIYIKYGPGIYEKYIPKMKAIDVSLEIGRKSKKTFVLNKIKYETKRTILPLFISGLTVFEGFPILIASGFDKIVMENSIIYANDIAIYNEKIKKYAKQFENINLTDLQIIMKVMNDMWSSIAGYGNPKKDIIGFLRLDFLEENGIGVCRNMSDDVSAKLNAINPEYNARTLAVKMENIPYRKNNIDNSKRPPKENETSNNVVTANENDFLYKLVVDLNGNHKVVLMDVPNDNISLIIDPTNPSIGVFKNGKIHMFSTLDGKLLTVRYLSTSSDGVSSIFDYNKRKIDSFFGSNKSIEELEQKYGVDAQNKALEYVLNLENDNENEKQKVKTR